jgi:hypothetical protein
MVVDTQGFEMLGRNHRQESENAYPSKAMLNMVDFRLQDSNIITCVPPYEKLMHA